MSTTGRPWMAWAATQRSGRIGTILKRHGAAAILTLGTALIGIGAPEAGAQPAPPTQDTNRPNVPRQKVPGFEPRISADEIDQLARTLNLDDEQNELLASLFDSYDPEVQRANAAAIKQQVFLRQALREDSRGTVILMQRMAESNVAWKQERDQLESQFFEDVRAILTPDQLDHWPEYLRDFRRRTSLAEGSELGGEGIDLVALADEVIDNPSDRESIQPTLDSYVTSLDNLLTDRMQTLHDIDVATAQGLMSESGRMGPLFDRLGRQRVAILRLNRQTVQSLGALLGTEAASQLERTFESRSFPPVFADTQADAYLELAYKLDDLSESQSASLDTIGTEYRTGLLPINHELAGLHFKKQEADPLGVSAIKDASDQTNPQNASDNDLAVQLADRISEIENDKQQYVTRYVRRILEVLTPDQRSRLPDPKLQPEDRIAEMIDAALDFVVTDLDLPEGADRREFIATVKHALKGLALKNVTIAMPNVTPDGRTEIPVTGATSDGQTVTVPIELKNESTDNDKKKKDRNDDGG